MSAGSLDYHSLMPRYSAKRPSIPVYACHITLPASRLAIFRRMHCTHRIEFVSHFRLNERRNAAPYIISPADLSSVALDAPPSNPPPPHALHPNRAGSGTGRHQKSTRDDTALKSSQQVCGAVEPNGVPVAAAAATTAAATLRRVIGSVRCALDVAIAAGDGRCATGAGSTMARRAERPGRPDCVTRCKHGRAGILPPPLHWCSRADVGWTGPGPGRVPGVYSRTHFACAWAGWQCTGNAGMIRGLAAKGVALETTRTRKHICMYPKWNIFRIIYYSYRKR